MFVRSVLAIVLVTVLAFAPSGAWADERSFLYDGGVILLCGSPSNPNPANGGIGGVCFEPNHIQIGPDGVSGIYFARACLDCPGLIPGHYCQSNTGPLMTPIGGLALCEFNDVDFCDALELVPGQNWDPNAWVYVTALLPGANGCGPSGVLPHGVGHIH